MFARKNKPWLSKSSRRRRGDLIRLRNDIRLTSKWFGGVFFSADVIDGASWADVFFLSKDRRKIYNATLLCACYAYQEELEEKANEEAEAILPFSFSFRRNPDSGFLSIDFEDESSPEYIEAFGEGGRRGFVSRRVADMANTKQYPIRESVELFDDYSFGIGLRAVVDVPTLTVGHVILFVERFLDSGEQPWRSERELFFRNEDFARNSISNRVGCHPSSWASSLEGKMVAEKERIEFSLNVSDSATTLLRRDERRL